MSPTVVSPRTCASIFLAMLPGCCCFRQRHPTKFFILESERPCFVQGLKSLDTLKVVHPPPVVDASPYSDRTDDKYHFKDLGSFNNSVMHYLMPPLQKNLTLEVGHGCEVQVDDQWRAAEVATKLENGGFIVQWRDDHTGKVVISANASERIRPAWSFWAASPMTVYLDFYASGHGKNQKQILSRFKLAGWERSSLTGSKIKKGRGIVRHWSTVGPGLVLERTFASGKMVTIPLSNDQKHNVLIWAKAECDMAKICSPSIGGWVFTGNIIGKGSQGTIFEVQRYPVDEVGTPQLYALKRPNSVPADGQTISDELKVMLDSASCEHVLEVIDSMPCVYSLQGHDGTSRHAIYQAHFEPYGYVMPKLANNMDTWFISNPPRPGGIRDQCMTKIHTQISAGLKCMHEMKWIHGDYKTDNVLYSFIGSDGCPERIRLIDFGLSALINEPQSFFSNSAYYWANHLVSGTFAPFPTPLHPTPLNRVDTLGIVVTTDEFPEGAWNSMDKVDWCSYLMVMRLWYGNHFRVRNVDYDCGIMGHERATWVKAEGNVKGQYALPSTQTRKSQVYHNRGSPPIPPETHQDMNLIADQAQAVYSPTMAVRLTNTASRP